MIGKLTAWKSTIGAKPNFLSRPLISQDCWAANLSGAIEAHAASAFISL
jgi:hypothetical protein